MIFKLEKDARVLMGFLATVLNVMILTNVLQLLISETLARVQLTRTCLLIIIGKY